MRGKKRGLKKAYILFLVLSLLVVGVINVSYTAYASSWTEKADKSIYGKDANIGSGVEDNLNDLLKSEKPSLGEQILIDIVVGFTNSLYTIMDGVGISLDSVIYGRVGGHTKDGINLFRFELQKGNPYGVVSSAIYNVITGINIIFIVLTAFGKLALAMYNFGSAQKRDEFKSSISVTLLSLALVFFMPYLLDVMLYIADVCLAAVSSEGATKLFATSEGFDIVNTFRQYAKSSFVNASIYLSTVFLSFYFAGIYIMYATTMVVLFIIFPVITVGMNFDKKLITQWFKQVFSIVIIPIMDCVLMMIPTYMGLLPRSGSMTIIKIFVCAMIVPARNVIRQILGLGSNSGLELMGVATMLGAFKLAETAGRTAFNYRRLSQGAREDMNMADFYQEAANMEAGEAAGGNSMAAGARGISSPGGGYGFTGGNFNMSSGGGTIGTAGGSYAGKASGSASFSGMQMGNPLSEKYADIHTFENPVIRSGLSNQKLADLYRERAKNRAKRAAFTAAGSAIGGLAGVGSSMFLGPSSKTYLTAMGMMAGGAAGDFLGDRRPGSFFTTGHVSRMNISVNDNVQDSGGAAGESTGFTYTREEPELSAVVNYTAAPNFVADDSVDKNVEEFCNANSFEGYRTIVNVFGEYSANNGERLKTIYNDVAQKNMGSTSETIYNEFRKKVSSDIIAKFNEGMDKNPNIRYSADNRVNRLVRESFTKSLENSLKDEEKGILSKDILQRYGITPDGIVS